MEYKKAELIKTESGSYQRLEDGGISEMLFKVINKSLDPKHSMKNIDNNIVLQSSNLLETWS